MSKRTIAKFYRFVIFLAATSAISAACSFASSKGGETYSASPYGSPRVIAKIRSKDLTEASGIAASRCQNDVLWTHNDSGDDAFIFAVNTHGDMLGTWRVDNAKNVDWEDVASFKDREGKCWVYIGEIGNNRLERPNHAIYRVREPIVAKTEKPSTRKDPSLTEAAEALAFTYPDYDQDAEALMVQPSTGDIYVVTKRVSGPAGVYKLKPEFGPGKLQKAEMVAQISVPTIPNGLLTGGDISPDGKHVIICDYTQAYEYVLPESAGSFDDIWKQQPIPVDLGRRENGEAVCYSVDGTSIYATSENRDPPLIEVKRK